MMQKASFKHVAVLAALATGWLSHCARAELRGGELPPGSVPLPAGQLPPGSTPLPAGDLPPGSTILRAGDLPPDGTYTPYPSVRHSHRARRRRHTRRYYSSRSRGRTLYGGRTYGRQRFYRRY